MPRDRGAFNWRGRAARRGLFGSMATTGANTLLSRVLGFVRDVVIARAFGASAEADAFFVAFRIPNLLRRLFAEGAFSQAFVPVLSEYRERRGPEEVRELVACVSGGLGSVLLGVSALGVAAAPLLVLLFAPGFLGAGTQYDLTVQMLRITFPYIFFISLTSFAAGILNASGRFGVPAFTPVLLNLSLIGATLWLAPRMAEPVLALAVGVLIAGVAQLAFQLPFLAALRLLVAPRLRWAHEGVKRIMRLILPAVFGASVAQINVLIDTLIASFLVAGSISWLYFSDRVVEVPLGVFGIAIATVILPALSARYARQEEEAFSRTLDWALRCVVLIAVPSALGLAMLSLPILATIFHHGAFTGRDVEMSSLSLVAYAFGLAGFMLVKVLAPGFFARQDTRTPVRIGVVALLANVVFNLALVLPLRHAGLALATALSAYLNAALLLLALRRAGVYRPAPGWRALGTKTLLAAGVMAALLWWGSGESRIWFEMTAGERAARLVALVAGGALAYLLSMAALGLRLRDLRAPGGR